jgi:hypothetical protein
MSTPNNETNENNEKASADERSRTLEHFFKQGRLVKWPSQLKKQQLVASELIKLFQPGVQYHERELDAILKEVYSYDHCTVRRALVDFKLLQRTNGIYQIYQHPESD